jgi:hypothetical protein
MQIKLKSLQKVQYVITLDEGFFLHAVLDVLLRCHQMNCTVGHW